MQLDINLQPICDLFFLDLTFLKQKRPQSLFLEGQKILIGQYRKYFFTQFFICFIIDKYWEPTIGKTIRSCFLLTISLTALIK